MLHLINKPRIPQIGAASGSNVSGGHGDRILKGSEPYCMRSRDGYGGMAEIGMDEAAGSKNTVGSVFLSSVVNKTI